MGCDAKQRKSQAIVRGMGSLMMVFLRMVQRVNATTLINQRVHPSALQRGGERVRTAANERDLHLNPSADLLDRGEQGPLRPQATRHAILLR